MHSLLIPHKLLILTALAFIIYAVAGGLFATAGLVIFAVTLCMWATEMVRHGDSQYAKIIGYAALISISLLLFVVTGKL